MKHSTSFKTKVLAIVLTIAALATGQTASATTKTYTVSGGQGNSPTEFYALFSDGSSSTDQVSWTYNSTAEISFSLPGGLTLKLSNTAKQLLVRDNNSIGGRGATTLTVSSQTYYIYHVRLLDSSGNVIQLDANGNAVTQGGVSQCDYWNMTKSFSHTFSNGILFSKIEVSYATAIPITDAVITGLSSQYSVSNTAIMPTPTVTWHGTTLTLGTHCTISYLNNTAAGTATVKATGKGIFSSSTSVSANYTLVWATYSVRFNKNNDAATGTMANQDFTYSTAQPLTANGFTTPTGYTFAGWNTAADGSGTSYSDEQEVQNLTATNGATVDLYAQWTPITYTLRLHHNDGTGAYTDMAMTYDQSKNIQSISRTGYTFAGWNTAADGSGTAYTDGQSVQNLTATDGATVDLYAQWTDVWGIAGGANGTEAHPYVITTTAGLDLLAQRVNSGNKYYGKFFKLGADITYNHTTDWDDATSTENNYTPIGGDFNSSGNDFRGTFDGQGHTVSGIRIYKGGSDADSYLGLFGSIYNGGVVKNVTVSDMRITGYSDVGGIVGQNDEGGSVENCHATATVCLNAVQGGAYDFGGIVGYNYQSDISNCTSAVTITVADNLTGCQDFGGIVGNIGLESSVSNCLAVGVVIPDIIFKDYYQNDVTASGAIAGYYYVYYSVLSNNYYTDCTLGGTPAASGIGVGYDDNNYARHDVTDNNGAVPATLHTLTLGENITAAGALLNQGGTIRVPAGSTVTLSYSGGEVAGQIVVFLLNGSELSGNSFTMPDADASVSASVTDVWGIAGGADGSLEHPYTITTTAGLDLLAQRVNSGNSYYDKYFVLANDITYTHTTDWDNAASTENNYTPIGGDFNSSGNEFLGTFDGQGHTVSGIRIYKGGSDYHADSYLGLFGCIYRPGVVKNVTVSDMRITGYSCVGGIVGRNYDGGSVENCHATATVCLNAVQSGANNFGGIVGNNNKSVINSCTSAVAITVADNLTGCQDFGGIVGNSDYGSSVSNCLAVGVAIPDISFKDYYQNDVTASGAIAGCFDVNSVLSNNYYTDCTLGGTPTASGIGVGYDYNNYARRDVTDNNGAVPAVVLQGRTLYKDGDWNTLCLPFDVEFAGSPLAGAEARTLSSASYADGTLTLNFSDPVETLTAGTPYIIRWEKASDYVNDDEHNIVNPVFTNVTIDNTARNVETTNVSFVGTYNAMSFTEENRSILLVGAGNSLFYPLSGASLGAFRAYFQLNGITAGDVSGNVKMFFGEEENETSLSEELRVKSEESDNAVYDLSGRKINSQLPKGIYIKNGKKVLINK